MRRLTEQHVQDTVAAILERNPCPQPWQGIMVSRDGVGTSFQVTTVRTVNGMSANWTERMTPDVNGGMTDESHERLERQVTRHARRKLRSAAIRMVPGADDPDWSHTMHRLQRAWMLHAGLDPAITINQSRLAVGCADVIGLLADQAGLVLGRIRVEDGRVDIAEIQGNDPGTSVMGSGISLVGAGRPCVLVPHELSMQMVQALPGLPIASVIDHPVLRRAGPVRIVEASSSNGLTTLVVEDVQDFIRRPPAGMDRSWARMPFMPKPGE